MQHPNHSQRLSQHPSARLFCPRRLPRSVCSLILILISSWMRRLYWQNDAFRSTTNFDHIKTHYFWSHPHVCSGLTTRKTVVKLIGFLGQSIPSCSPWPRSKHRATVKLICRSCGAIKIHKYVVKSARIDFAKLSRKLTLDCVCLTCCPKCTSI